MGNIFNKGLKEEDKKEGLFKRLENIKDKNEELLNAFSAANKVSKTAKNESDFNYDFKYAFYKFHRDFKKFKRMSLGSKYNEMNDFYTLLNAFINTHKATNTETKDRKDRIMNNIKPLYDMYFDAYKKNYDSEKVKDEEKRQRGYKQIKIIGNGDQEPKSTKKEETETKNIDEIHKSLWVKLNKSDFNSLTQDVYKNLTNDEFKTTVNKKAYELTNAKKFLEKIITQKISKEDPKELYSDLTTPDITGLQNVKGKGKNKRYKILEVLENLKSVFTGVCLHYKDVPSESEESTAERTKLRRQRSDEITNKEDDKP